MSSARSERLFGARGWDEDEQHPVISDVGGWPSGPDAGGRL